MKQNNIQPWLDYFDMLRTYIQQGYLEMMPATHEAFITLPALQSLANAMDLIQRLQDGESSKMLAAEMWSRIKRVVLNIRTYSQFLNVNAEAYKQYAATVETAVGTPATVDTMEQIDKDGRVARIITGNRRQSFVLHVVSDTPPHDVGATIIVTRRRRWYWPWHLTDNFGIIYY